MSLLAGNTGAEQILKGAESPTIFSLKTQQLHNENSNFAGRDLLPWHLVMSPAREGEDDGSVAMCSGEQEDANHDL